uniref:Uncharacterized protein n=1 Tax=Arundo donax TaxID=35708 RepID=A0A0A9GP91_ARUDO
MASEMQCLVPGLPSQASVGGRRGVTSLGAFLAFSAQSPPIQGKSGVGCTYLLSIYNRRECNVCGGGSGGIYVCLTALTRAKSPLIRS